MRTYSSIGRAIRKQMAPLVMTCITRPEYFLAAAAAVTFPLAVLFPFFRFEPRLFDPLLEALVDYTDPGSMDPTSYSVLGGIARLFVEGDALIAVVLFIFSVVFPACKLALLWGVLLRPNRTKLGLVKKLERLGPWSMADVFALSVTILAFKSFPGGTQFNVQTGYYLFLVSVLTGLVATLIAKSGLEGMQPEGAATQPKEINYSGRNEKTGLAPRFGYHSAKQQIHETENGDPNNNNKTSLTA